MTTTVSNTPSQVGLPINTPMVFNDGQNGIITISVESVLPEMAQIYLTTNDKNRKKRPHRVARYAQAMINGRWNLTGEAIIFDNEGRLINGQHRMQAAVDSGKAFTTLVVRGVERTSFANIDSGLTRTAADVLLDRDRDKYSTQQAAAARLVIAYNAGQTRNTDQMLDYVDNSTIVDEITSNADLYDEVIEKIKARPQYIIMSSLIAFGVLAYDFYDDPDARDWLDLFFEGLIEGANLSKGDPRLAMRNWASGSARTKSNTLQMYGLIHAWNAFSAGRTLDHIRVIRKESMAPALRPWGSGPAE